MQIKLWQIDGGEYLSRERAERWANNVLSVVVYAAIVRWRCDNCTSCFGSEELWRLAHKCRVIIFGHRCQKMFAINKQIHHYSKRQHRKHRHKEQAIKYKIHLKSKHCRKDSTMKTNTLYSKHSHKCLQSWNQIISYKTQNASLKALPLLFKIL